MMDLSMFTGFEGRINRAKWWIGTIILAVIGLILSWILSKILGFGASLVPPNGLAITPDLLGSYMRKVAIAQLIILIILVYPGLSIMIKRLNDRDRPSWYAYVFLLPSALGILFGVLGLTMTMGAVSGTAVPVPSGLGWVIDLFSLAIGIWALIELGLLRGTPGSNRHGPDPLGT